MPAKQSQAKKPKSSPHLPAILEALEETPGLTTGDIAEHIGISVSTARDILTTEVKIGTIARREVDDDGATEFRFFNIDDEEAEPEPENVPRARRGILRDTRSTEDIDREFEELVANGEKSLEAAMIEALVDVPHRSIIPENTKEVVRIPPGKRKARPAIEAGKGDPTAKKSMNPQKTLEDKKKIARELGGKLEWINRKWLLTIKGQEQTITSQEIASYSLVDWRKKLGG